MKDKKRGGKGGYCAGMEPYKIHPEPKASKDYPMNSGSKK